jgi:hypothetical protein
VPKPTAGILAPALSVKVRLRDMAKMLIEKLLVIFFQDEMAVTYREHHGKFWKGIHLSFE